MMFARSIKDALSELAEATGISFNQTCLERSSTALLHHPEDGESLVHTLGSAERDQDAVDDMLQILSAALDGARMAQEGGQARGSVLIATFEETVAELASKGGLTMYGSLSLSRAWVRAGLAPPEQLGDPREDLDQPELGPLDPDQAEAMFDELFGELIEQADGDVTVLHEALAEMLPSLPADVRGMIVATTTARPGDIFGRLGCAFLLDPSEDTRLAAALGLADRLTKGHLEAEVAAQLVMLRSWLPEDAARTRLDTVLRDAIRQGVSGGSISKPWTVHKVLATMPDGTGAQSIGISLQSGSRRSLAMLLLKQDFGVKDAYVIPCTSASEQRNILDSLEAKTNAMVVAPGYLRDALVLALGDGVAHGLPPAPGLVEIAELCGLTGLRPQNQTTAELVSTLDPDDDLAARSPQARGRLINASKYWPDDHPLITDSWFEDSDASHEALDEPRTSRAMDTALWKWLETRRDWWARIIARSAMLLQTGGHRDAESFIATAQSLLTSRALRKIPIMLDIHEQTISAWLYGDAPEDSFSPEIDMHMLGEGDDLPAPPAPEKKGELVRLLNGTELSAHSIDGYLAAICIAPKMITPDRWLTPVLNAVLPDLPAPSLQRFLDLLLHRYNAAIEKLTDPKGLDRMFRRMNTASLRDWSAGFLEGKQNFNTSWPARPLGANDKAMLRQIEAMARDPATPITAFPALAAWLTSRLDALDR